MSDNDEHLPEKREPEEIPEVDPEIIPSADEPYENLNQQQFGGSRFVRMNLNCCGCSGSTFLLIILGVVLLILLYAKR